MLRASVPFGWKAIPWPTCPAYHCPSQALSFHDPTPFRVDPASIPDAQKAIMAVNGAALAIYAGSAEMSDPTLLGRLRGIGIPTLVLWGESDRIVEPADLVLQRI